MVDFASLLHFSRDESCCGSLLSYKGLVSEVLLANFSLKGQIVNIWSFVTQEAKLSSLFFFFFFNLAVLGVSCSTQDLCCCMWESFSFGMRNLSCGT